MDAALTTGTPHRGGLTCCRRWAPPQRGARTPPDGRVRGARALPGAGRVAQPRAARRARGALLARARSSPPSSPTSRWSITVLRMANRIGGAQEGQDRQRSPRRSRCSPPRASRRWSSRTAIFDFFERTPGWDAAPERFRLHAVATQSAADRLARELDYGRRATSCSSPPCCTTSASSCSCTPTRPTPSRSTARRAPPRSASTASAASWASTTRWSAASSPAAGACPNCLATAIERHHSDEAEGEAAIVRLADMLAHYGHGQPVDPQGAAEGRARARADAASSCAR